MEWRRLTWLLLSLAWWWRVVEGGEGKVHPSVARLLGPVERENYLWYAPHSGFGNQLIGFRHALRAAALLNRTLIVPPVLRHFDLWFGRCELGTARHPDLMRKHAWRAVSRLLISENYISMADVVDVSGLDSKLVKTIDLRLFAAVHCGLNVSVALTNCTWCGEVLRGVRERARKTGSPLLSEKYPGDPMEKCGYLLGNLGKASNDFDAQAPPLVAQVRRDCSDTIWTYGRSQKGEMMDTFRTGKLSGQCARYKPGIPPEFEHQYIEEGLVIMMKAERPLPMPLNLVTHLGAPETVYGEARILSLGSTMHFYDFEALKADRLSQEVSCATAFLPFTRPIMQAAKMVALSREHFADNFVCLHYRGGDGIFSDPAVLNATTFVIRQQLKALWENVPENLRRDVILFVMTDLISYRWRQRIRRMFSEWPFNFRFANYLSHLQPEVLAVVQGRRYGLVGNRVSRKEAQVLMALDAPVAPDRNTATTSQRTFGRELLQLTLFLEQAVCSCASVDFIGHPDSTISQNVIHIRAGGLCSRDYRGW